MGEGSLARVGAKFGNSAYLRAGAISLALCCGWDSELRGARFPLKFIGQGAGFAAVGAAVALTASSGAVFEMAKG